LALGQSTILFSFGDPWPLIDVMPRISPELTAIVVCAFLLTPLALAVSRRRTDAPPRPGGWLRRRIGGAMEFVVRRPFYFIGGVTAGLTALIQILVPFNPRYLTLGLPFFFVVIARGLDLMLGRRWTVGILAALCIFHLLNADGRWYPAVEPVIERYPHAYYLRERSNSYLDDHRSNIDAVRIVAEKCADDVILAEPPFGQYLAFPQLGVVDKPLRGFCFGVHSDFATAFRHGDADSALRLAGPKGIVVIGRHLPIHLPPKKEDILWSDDREPKLIVYRLPPKQFPPAARPPALQWSLENAGAAKLVQDPAKGSLRIDFPSTSDPADEVVVKESHRRFSQGAGYVVRFRARSNVERRVRFAVDGLTDPRLGHEWFGRMDEQWTNFQFHFVSNDADGVSRLTMQIPSSPGWVEIERFESTEASSEWKSPKLQARNAAEAR
jgi:hypothetical protein